MHGVIDVEWVVQHLLEEWVALRTEKGVRNVLNDVRVSPA